MIIVQLKGGLGNQLFVYAFAYAQSKKYDMPLVFDKYIYDLFYFREYELELFNVGNLIYLSDRGKCKNIFDKFLYKVARKIKLLKYNVKYINETSTYELQTFALNKKNNYYVSGYWQNYKYFNEYRSDIINNIRLKKLGTNYMELQKRIESSENAVVIHIRRGDYVNFNGGKCLKMSYYDKAIKLMSEQKKSEFWVISDDIDFCKKYFEGRDFQYISKEYNLSAVEEFWLMAHFRRLIIGNSTFSWWAAYLSKSDEVIAPVVDMWKEDFYLPEWIKIDAEI